MLFGTKRTSQETRSITCACFKNIMRVSSGIKHIMIIGEIHLGLARFAIVEIQGGGINLHDSEMEIAKNIIKNGQTI
jgi:hypothetical protein